MTPCIELVALLSSWDILAHRFSSTSRTFCFSEAVPFALVCTGLKAYLTWACARCKRMALNSSSNRMTTRSRKRKMKEKQMKTKTKMKIEAARRGKKR